jgi:hypothetical protein
MFRLLLLAGAPRDLDRSSNATVAPLKEIMTRLGAANTHEG